MPQPAQNMAVFSSATNASTSNSNASSDSAAARRKGMAKPARSAPKAKTFAASKPVRSPPEAIKGRVGAIARTAVTQSAVGYPQSRKVRPNRRCKGSVARPLSTWAQDVPPAPATSIAATPVSNSRFAIGPAMPLPTSFAMTGTGKRLHTCSILDSRLEKLRSPRVCTASWRGFKCKIKASASRISTTRWHCSTP